MLLGHEKLGAYRRVKEDSGVYALEKIDFDPDFDFDPEEPNCTFILSASASWLWVAGKGPL